MALVPAPPCPVCGASETRALYPLRDLLYDTPGSWTFARCDGCGHGMIDPRPDDADLAAIYASYYDRTITGFMAKLNESGLVRRFHKGRLRAILDAVGERPVRRIVDVGCGLGHFLVELRALLRERSGEPVEAIGVEPGEAAARDAEARLAQDAGDGPVGQVMNSSIDEVSIDPGSVDVLSMNHFLEHHPRPREVLARAADLVAPGGLIEVEVPRLDGLPRRLFRRWWWLHIPPQHLHLFTRDGLPRLLRDVGFGQVLSVRTGGLPFQFTLAWRFWLRHTLGSRSRFAGNALVQIPVWIVGLSSLLPLMVFDAFFGPLTTLSGGGDVLTVVARRDP
jgi:SAM-dependent methyltransferase